MVRSFTAASQPCPRYVLDMAQSTTARLRLMTRPKCFLRTAHESGFSRQKMTAYSTAANYHHRTAEQSAARLALVPTTVKRDSTMMQGIWTKYSGSRIKAIARTRNSWGGDQPEMALRLAYDYALNADENHAAAAVDVLEIATVDSNTAIYTANTPDSIAVKSLGCHGANVSGFCVQMFM